jgi:hypothetical protein
VSVSTASASALSSFIAKPETPIREKQIVFTYCSVRYLSVFVCPRSFTGFLQMGGYCMLKSNGGDSGNRIFVLYWRCPLIRVSVIRGSTVALSR